METIFEIAIFSGFVVVAFIGVWWWHSKQKNPHDPSKLPKEMEYWEPDADPDKVKKAQDVGSDPNNNDWH
ncbi:MAG: hypothetical protein AAGE61_18385 [Pseudomonadota bacterium]